MFGFKVVQQGSVGVVLRFGKYKRINQPGISYVTPFIERMIKVDVRSFPRPATGRRSSRRTTCRYG